MIKLQEQKTAEELVQMEASGGNIFIKMEVRGKLIQHKVVSNRVITNRNITQLKFLYDLIVNKPAVTSLSNLFVLNKAFALQVSHHMSHLYILVLELDPGTLE